MNANSKLWASQVDPVIREYVNARISEELGPIRDDIAAFRVALLGMREGYQSANGDLTARVNGVEELLNMSTTRVARLRQLADEE